MLEPEMAQAEVTLWTHADALQREPRSLSPAPAWACSPAHVH